MGYIRIEWKLDLNVLYCIYTYWKDLEMVGLWFGCIFVGSIKICLRLGKFATALYLICNRYCIHDYRWSIKLGTMSTFHVG